QAGVGDAPGYLRHPKWSTAAAWFDADGDGRLDLYVGNYCEWDRNSRQLCIINGVETACTPAEYPPQPDLFYRNRGGGRFALDVNTFVLKNRVAGRALAVLP